MPDATFVEYEIQWAVDLAERVRELAAQLGLEDPDAEAHYAFEACFKPRGWIQGRVAE